jgi:hypothetical protein
MRKSGVQLDRETLSLVQRRRENRFACLKPIYVRPFAQSVEEKFLYSRLLDCSEHGLCVLTPAPMQPKEQFLLKLWLERLSLILYTVRNCIQADYASWRIGAEFREIVGLSHINASDVVLESLLKLPDKPIIRSGILNAP